MEQVLGKGEHISMEDVKRTYLGEFSDVFGVRLEKGDLADLESEPSQMSLAKD
jgi:hypothetical protein